MYYLLTGLLFLISGWQMYLAVKGYLASGLSNQIIFNFFASLIAAFFGGLFLVLGPIRKKY